jgi:hypothetical protein
VLLPAPSSGFGPVSRTPPGRLLCFFNRGSDRIRFSVFARSSVRAPRSASRRHFSLLLLISGIFFRFRCPVFIPSYCKSRPRARQSQFLRSAQLIGLQFDAECPRLFLDFGLRCRALRILVYRSGIHWPCPEYRFGIVGVQPFLLAILPIFGFDVASRL